jgi:hypothetical protein
MLYYGYNFLYCGEPNKNTPSQGGVFLYFWEGYEPEVRRMSRGDKKVRLRGLVVCSSVFILG